jgi:hypothetical protein
VSTGDPGGQPRPAGWLPDSGGAKGRRRSAWLRRRGEQARLPPGLAQTLALMETTARADNDIADTLTSLASLDGSNLAAQRQQLAEASASGVRRAHERAQERRQLAETSGAKERPW